MKNSPEKPAEEQRTALQDHPGGHPVLFQSWEHLLFLHWIVDAGEIQRTLPPGLTVDCYENQAYISIVPFYMKRIRPRFLPAIPYFSYFLECNVRTYVHDAQGVPGVWFYSLDTNRWLAHWIGRRFFHLPYFWARMATKENGAIHYTMSRRSVGDRAGFTYQAGEEAAVAKPGTLDFFLLERYLLYSRNSATGRLCRARVHHAPYRAAPARLEEFSSRPIVWNGLPAVAGDPVHACVADRVDVKIFGIEEASTREAIC